MGHRPDVPEGDALGRGSRLPPQARCVARWPSLGSRSWPPLGRSCCPPTRAPIATLSNVGIGSCTRLAPLATPQGEPARPGPRSATTLRTGTWVPQSSDPLVRCGQSRDPRAISSAQQGSPGVTSGHSKSAADQGECRDTHLARPPKSRLKTGRPPDRPRSSAAGTKRVGGRAPRPQIGPPATRVPGRPPSPCVVGSQFLRRRRDHAEHRFCVPR